jgi:hypothetical protein
MNIINQQIIRTVNYLINAEVDEVHVFSCIMADDVADF